MTDTTRQNGAASRRTGMLLAVLLAAFLLVPAAGARAADPAPFAMGTDLSENSFTGKWMRLVYAEAFRRLGIPLDIGIYPLKRLSSMLDAGELDGELLRVHAYAADHPNLLRVEEPVLEVVIVLYATNPELQLNRLEELPAKDWYADYRRGVGVCERLLENAFPRDRIYDVTTTEQGLRKLLAGRADIYCDLDLAVLAELYSNTFQGVTNVRKLYSVGNPIPLHPYLHRKNAGLAPRLAATLKQMKVEGLIQRYRAEAENSAGSGR